MKFKLQLGAILLKLNEHNLNISKNENSIKNNDNDIKSNYDICIANKNSLIDIDKEIYALNNSVENIDANIVKINNDVKNINDGNDNNKNIIKHNYSIENIWFYNIDILNDYIITKSKPVVSLFEYVIDGEFIVNSILEITCNIIHKYANYNGIGLLRHTYSLIDANNNLIHTHNIIHTNSGDNFSNHLTINDNFRILFANSLTDKLKIELQLTKVDLNRNDSIGFRILNPYKNNILCVMHIKYLSEK